MSESVEAAKAGALFVTELLKSAKDDPNVRESGSNLGKSALTITGAINNALLPLAAVNFAFDRARKYFAERFADDLAVRAASIPASDLVEPKGSIAGPALQGLAFAHEEPDLREMYLNLLATAMDGRCSAVAHPAFVEVLKQVDSEEARLLKLLLGRESMAVVEVRLERQGEEGWRVLDRHLMNLYWQQSKEPMEDRRLAAMVDNAVRLGLVEVSYDIFLTGSSSYSWVEQRPEYARHKSLHETGLATVTFERGILRRTAFGVQFATAVGLLDSASA